VGDDTKIHLARGHSLSRGADLVRSADRWRFSARARLDVRTRACGRVFPCTERRSIAATLGSQSLRRVRLAGLPLLRARFCGIGERGIQRLRLRCRGCIGGLGSIFVHRCLRGPPAFRCHPRSRPTRRANCGNRLCPPPLFDRRQADSQCERGVRSSVLAAARAGGVDATGGSATPGRLRRRRCARGIDPQSQPDRADLPCASIGRNALALRLAKGRAYPVGAGVGRRGRPAHRGVRLAARPDASRRHPDRRIDAREVRLSQPVEAIQ